MYFIQEGVVVVLRSNGQVAATLADGSYFGGESQQCRPAVLAYNYVFTFDTIRYDTRWWYLRSLNSWQEASLFERMAPKNEKNKKETINN